MKHMSRHVLKKREFQTIRPPVHFTASYLLPYLVPDISLLLQIHGPIRIKKGTALSPENFLPTEIPATWGAMEKLYDSGKARAIGVSNFSCKKLEDLLAVARVPPAVNQVECHLVWQQDKLRKLCQLKGVHLSVSVT
jgi:diketogulonate reductase-like aldo/keto reductase